MYKCLQCQLEKEEIKAITEGIIICDECKRANIERMNQFYDNLARQQPDRAGFWKSQKKNLSV